MQNTKIGAHSKKKYAFLTIFIISCSMLMFEVLLTRICALRLFFHFGFLVVSNCLLGVGASGSMIFILQERFEKRVRFWVCFFCLLYFISLAGTYAFLIKFKISESIHFHSISSIIRFSIYNLTAAIPFFFAGTIIGLLLTFNADQVNKIYGIDLLGAGLGCLLCPLLLWKTGAGGCVVFIALLTLIGIFISARLTFRRFLLVPGIIIGLFGMYILPKLDNLYPVPCKEEIDITGSMGLELQKNIIFSRWSATSRIDLVSLPKNKRNILGLGEKCKKSECNELLDSVRIKIPDEKWIMQDGSAGTYILNFSDNPEALALIEQSLYSVGLMLKESPRVFIIGVGGGNDVWAAKANDAQYIKGVELNQQILDIHENVLSDFSKALTEDPNIELIFEEGRSALMRDNSTYDIIQMTGIDTWTSLTSGAYVLAENYLYTVEAISAMYEKLNDQGILSIARFAQTMETLRILSNIFAAIDDKGRTDFPNSVLCLGNDILRTILIKKGFFSSEELNKIDNFSENYGFTFVYHPQLDLGTSVEEFVRTSNKQQFIDDFPRNISPTLDDQPYFFNYTKWSRLFSSKKYIKEHSSVSQGNPLFIFCQLLVSTLLALTFILLPVLIFIRKGVDKTYMKRFLIYFMGLGLGFIAIEIALMQKLVLFLGHPLYSITVTLFSMLIFAGIGSIISNKWFHTHTSRAWLIPIGLALLIGLFILFSPSMVEAWIVWPTFLRILVCVGVLIPISLILGIPFAYGIRLLNQFNPTIIPWAWAINGCMTVIGAILAVIVSMNLGFNAVLITAIVVYFMSFLAVSRLKS